jgi:hypothetical protein
MIPMSEDEVVVLLIACCIGGLVWLQFLARMLMVRSLYRSGRLAALAVVSVAACGIVLFAMLKTLAAHDVRDDGRYLAFYMLMGAAWVGLMVVAFPWFGLSARDDIAERKNLAATIMFGGAVLGATLAFGQANIGDGPGWWCVVFAAILSSLAWLAAWGVLEKLAFVSDSVTVDRDNATGLRVAALLAMLGLLCGRGAAGDWTSASQTVIEFAAAWPAVPLLAAGIFIERRLRPGVLQGFGSITLHGIAPAALYLAGALAGLAAVGLP